MNHLRHIDVLCVDVAIDFDMELYMPSTTPSSTLAQNPTGSQPKTLGSMIGELVWLMTQSPIHRELALKELEWLLMPAVVLGQYKIFKNEQGSPIGAALWAYLTPDAEAKFKAKGKLEPEDWGNNATLDPAKGLIKQPGGTLWLIELIAPFHQPSNSHRELMIQDLLTTALKGEKLKMVHINPETQQKEEIELG